MTCDCATKPIVQPDGKTLVHLDHLPRDQREFLVLLIETRKKYADKAATSDKPIG